MTLALPLVEPTRYSGKLLESETTEWVARRLGEKAGLDFGGAGCNPVARPTGMFTRSGAYLKAG